MEYVMSKLIFENSELYFQNFPLGTLSGEIEFRGTFESSITEKFSRKHYAQIQSTDISLRFSLKEKSTQLLELLKNPIPPDLKSLISNFGTITIKTPDKREIKISEAFWTHYPVPEFQLRHNSEKHIHSLYFLW